MRLCKKLSTISVLIILITICLVVYFYLQRDTKTTEAEQIKTLLAELNEAGNMIDAVKSEMPKELLETHNYLVSGALEGKLYKANPKLKDLIMYHGAKTQSVYINTALKLTKELWIPVFYHEVAHSYWHAKDQDKTFEELESQLFNSENYAYTVNAQVWDLVMRYYPIEKGELETELEQRLFRIYSDETKVYNEMIKGNPEAKELWVKIIEADIKEREKYQKLLFEK